jgi:pentatricopeptide repeat protein
MRTCERLGIFCSLINSLAMHRDPEKASQVLDLQSHLAIAQLDPAFLYA